MCGINYLPVSELYLFHSDEIQIFFETRPKLNVNCNRFLNRLHQIASKEGFRLKSANKNTFQAFFLVKALTNDRGVT